jgi:formylglycine-generating enzyme required for sulfatase activity
MKILILAANPSNTDSLRLDREIRDIEEGLIRAQQRDRFEMVQRWAVSFKDLQRAILELNPQIVHFSGHGAGERGLVLEDGQGQAQLISTDALARLFELFADQVQCVLLNACYSEVQGQAIARHIPYVIGMKQAIGDTAAREFSGGFYDALGAGRDIEFAYQLGCNRIQPASMAEHLTPVLLTSKMTPPAPGATQVNTPGSLPTEPPDSSESGSSYSRFSFEVVTVNPQGQILDRQQSSAPYQTVDLGQGVSLDMVLIPGGTFMMGQTEVEKTELIRQVGEENYKECFARELPRHSVTLGTFALGKYPVTQAQWRAVTALPRVRLKLDPDPSHFKGDNRPVEQVNWHEAIEFCARLSVHSGQTYSLPSEAQWEYAARAGTTTPFHFGETLTTDLANYNGEYTFASGSKGVYRQETTEVGSFPPNGFGLYDMHGNVWEWCLDHWHDNYEGAPADGSAWVTGGYTLRGGSWFINPGYCRCASRCNIQPGDRSGDGGFRVVSVPPRALGKE